MTGSPGAGQEHEEQANKSRGRQHLNHNHKRTTSPTTHTGKDGWTDGVERSHSPRKTERGHSGSLEDMNKDRKAQGQRDHHSSSPRKGSRREHDPSRNLDEPQSPRHPAGQQPSISTGDAKDRRYKGEDTAYMQEREATESWGTGEHHRRGKRAEKEATVQRSYRERSGSDAETGTLTQRSGRERGDHEYWESKYHGPAEEVSRNDPRGSSSSIHDPSLNGNSASKKAPITPGPWKVPSSARIQSQVDATYAEI